MAKKNVVVFGNIEILEAEFQKPRTPQQLAQYVESVRNLVRDTPELQLPAFQHRRPFKRFSEELSPFSRFCSWRFGTCSEFLCCLAEEGAPEDARVNDLERRLNYAIQISCPEDGIERPRRARELTTIGFTREKIEDINDSTNQRNAINSFMIKAQQKSLIDYTSEGPSLLLMLFDDADFFSSIPSHEPMLAQLFEKLARLKWRIEAVVLYLIFRQRFVVVVPGRLMEGFVHRQKVSETPQ